MKKLLWLALIFYSGTLGAQELISKEWLINGVKRQALIYVPAQAKKQKSPLIFAFHGHGGTMRNCYQGRKFEKFWPEAITIYPQGLNTPGTLTDPEGKYPGWLIKDTTLNNRDLQFFDQMLLSLKQEFQIDDNRIYATGHSNGGAFVYFLWATRPTVFAAFAPTAASVSRFFSLRVPKPALHLMGEQDPLVKPIVQRFTINRVKKLNDCSTKAEVLSPNLQRFEGNQHNDLWVYTHAGGHGYPAAANEIIVNFFKAYQKH